jgi:hypothetical protein
MTDTSSDELFRQAAEEEGGMPVSAGARVAHLRSAVATGRGLYIDLSDVPDDKRPALVEEIRTLVKRAGRQSRQQGAGSAPDATKTSTR